MSAFKTKQFLLFYISEMESINTIKVQRRHHVCETYGRVYTSHNDLKTHIGWSQSPAIHVRLVKFGVNLCQDPTATYPTVTYNSPNLQT